MPAPEQILADLADHPPIAPTPVGQIHVRARRRVRRRRALGALATVVVVLAVGAGAATVVGDEPTDDVSAGPGVTPTDAPATSDPTSSTAGSVPVETLSLSPADGLVDGTVVELSLDEPATGAAVVVQSASEVGEVPSSDPAGALDWCTGMVEGRAEALAPFTVRRVVDTATGPVDCATEPGRCVLAVRVGPVDGGADHVAALRFHEDLPALPESQVVVDGDEGSVGDGDRLLLTFTDVLTGETISISQCVALPEGEDDERLCSSARSVTTTVQEGPETQIAFTAFHDVFVDGLGDDVYAPRWTFCAPCELVVWVGERRAPVAFLPMDLEPTDAPIRPVVTVDRPGPVAPGSTVGVRATGLQPGSTVGVGWCPTERFQGGGDPPCVGSTGPDADLVTVADDGTLAVDGLLVPGADTALPFADCAVADQCGVGLDAGDLYSVMAIAPMTISPY